MPVCNAEKTSVVEDRIKEVLGCYEVNRISGRGLINDWIKDLSSLNVAALVVEARRKCGQYYAPLLLIRCMAKHPQHKYLVADLLEEIMESPDELVDFCEIYWSDDGRQPLSAQVKKGLAKAFVKFEPKQFLYSDAYSAIKLWDIMALVHPKPKTEEQEILFRDLANGKLPGSDIIGESETCRATKDAHQRYSFA